MTQPALQRDALPAALVAVGRALYWARTLDEALSATTQGLEALGFDVAFLEFTKNRYRVRSLSRRGPLDELAQRLPVQLSGSWAGQGVIADQASFIADLKAATRGWLARMGATERLDEAIERVVRAAAVVAPVPIHEGLWGRLVFMHDDLCEADVPLLSLFAQQVGSTLAALNGVTRLARRTAELELVHRLALSSTRSDLRELCQQALEVVCHTTGADAGTVHQFDQATARFSLLGEPYGYAGPLLEVFRSFETPDGMQSLPLMTMAVEALPVGGEALLAEGFRFIANVPLVLEEQGVGLLSLLRRTPEPFDDAELRSAEILGLQMASLLERQRLYLHSERLYADLKASYDELARAQAEVVRHERLAALGELAAVMAHEVRNPLGVIFNSLTTLKRLTRPTGDAEMLLNMVGEEADRLNRIVADLLDFARPYELVKRPVAIEPFVAGAVDAAAQVMTASVPLKVVTTFDRELPPFPIDAHLLRQALINLVVNAGQAMPRGGVVTVSARIESKGQVPWLIIEVCDEGLGLSTRATEKMFQPFFTTKATGTGLGLAVVKRIVESHGGEVSARANPERGTTFEIRVPGGSERESVVTPPRPSPSAPRR
ncbi:MAG: GAF domain-containing protein [Myxococcus sp.]|nr:GAF domain-containing protein [Myxococcus sp.]